MRNCGVLKGLEGRGREGTVCMWGGVGVGCVHVRVGQVGLGGSRAPNRAGLSLERSSPDDPSVVQLCSVGKGSFWGILNRNILVYYLYITRVQGHRYSKRYDRVI